MTRAALLLLVLVALASCTGDAKRPATVAAATSPLSSPAATPAGTTITEPSSSGAPAATPTPPATGAPLQPEFPRVDLIDLARRLRGAVPPPAAAPARTEQAGTQHEFWVVQTEPPRAFQVTATLRVVSDHAYFYVQDGAGADDAQMRQSARDFEDKVYPTITRMFGEPAPSAVDPDPRITILNLRLPNVGGYFTNVDTLPRAVAPLSNERRMIYIALQVNPPGSTTYLATVAHEFQHLIHHGHNRTAEPWINEGLSDYAAAIIGGEGQSNLRSYRDAPGTQLNDWSVGGSNAPHYGAAHAFLRYLLSHYGGPDRAKDLASEGGLGVNEVEKYLQDGGYGVRFEDVFADWLAADYLELPDGRFSNPGADTKVRKVRQVGAGDSGDGSVNQFGADYFELAPGNRDLHFQFKGDPTVKQVPNTPAGGSGEWWSGRGDSMDATLTRAVDLSGVQGATLRFKTWYDIERGFDFAYVMVSEDGGTTWTALRGRQTSDFDPLSQAYGPGYTGPSGSGGPPAWVDEQVDLSAYAGRRILLRFEYITDESSNGAGFALDDISIPEIGFTDDAERDTGWQAAGFSIVSAPLPQRYLIQLVDQDNGAWTTHRITTVADGSADITIPAGEQRVAVIIAGATYGTNLPASYHWSVDRR
jgi:hypothetical protein